MNALGLMQLLGTAPLFASRAFLAAFLVAITARFGQAIPWLADSSALQTLQSAPPWFTGDIALVALAVLALLEAVAERNVDTRRVLAEIGPYIKLASALAINLGLADAQSAALLQQLGAEAPSEHLLRAGLEASHVLAAAVAMATFGLAILRKRTLSFLTDADEDDALGLQGVLVWVEDAFVFGGVAALAIFPALAMVLLAGTALSLFAMERWTAARESSRLVDCEACQAPVHPSAPWCPRCDATREARDISALGQPMTRPARARHPQRLLSVKRCPHCATRLASGRLDQACGACGRPAFATRRDVEDYVTAVQWQLPKTLLVCAAFGAVPLLGLVPGIIFYRLSLLGGLSRYLPTGSGMATRWLSRFLTIALLSLQWIPGIGAAMLPLLCLSNFWLYRRALLGAAGDALPTAA